MLAYRRIKTPKIFNLKGAFWELFFTPTEKTVIIRRTIFELDKALARVHILEGLKKAIDNIDRVIAIVKESKESELAKKALKSKFELSDIQTSAILEMKIRRLTGLEQDKIEGELNELHSLIEYLRSILKSETILNGIIKDELLEIGERFKGERLTEIVL